MKTLEELAIEAGMGSKTFKWMATDEVLAKFAALPREAVIAELVARSGEPIGWLGENSGDFIRNVGQRKVSGKPFYTADQLAGAVARERERCLALVDNHFDYTRAECVAAIRSGK